MGLLNVYKNLSTLRPHIGYRFNCEIWDFNVSYDIAKNSGELYSYTIKKISQPTFKIGTDERTRFGNTQYLIPILKFGETSLNITFEETDNMDVTTYLLTMYGTTPYNSMNTKLINVRVLQFDESMTNVIDEKVYVSRIKNFDMPGFNNTSLGSPVEISAEFNVVYTFNNIESLNAFRLDKTGKIIRGNLSSYDFAEEIKNNKTNEQRFYSKTYKAGLLKLLNSKSDEINNKKTELIKNAENTFKTTLNMAFNRGVLNNDEVKTYSSLIDFNDGLDENERNIIKTDILGSDAFTEPERNYLMELMENDALNINKTQTALNAIANANRLGNDEESIKQLESMATTLGYTNDDFEKIETQQKIPEIKTSNTNKAEKLQTSYNEGSNQVNTKYGTTTFNVSDTTTINGINITTTDITSSWKNKAGFNQEGYVNKGEELFRFELHRTAGNKDMGISGMTGVVADSGVSIFMNADGSLVINEDRIFSARSSATKNGSTKNTIAIEVTGAVDIVQGEDGKYYERVVTGKKSGNKDIIYQQITDINAYNLSEYTDENSSGLLKSTIEKKKGSTTQAVDNLGNTVNVKIKNVYANQYTQQQLKGFEALGEWAKSKGLKKSDALEFISHGMIDDASGKTEGNADTNKSAKDAFLRGFEK